jgi:hypothetical protein
MRLKLVLAFILAVVTTYVVAVLAYTQLNLANVVEMGLPVSLMDRVGAAGHDLIGMTSLYLPIIAVALLLAFGFTAIVLRWVPQLRTLGYMLAGFVGIFVVDYALGALLTGGTHPLAVTRTTVGLLSQCVAGALGGYVFVLLSSKTE